MLFCFSIDDHGLLVHCISGWDRTPLFISLLRVSLWADGWIHQSLTVEEMLYLTLAYDWYLFGYEFKKNSIDKNSTFRFFFVRHCLPERLERGEEVKLNLLINYDYYFDLFCY